MYIEGLAILAGCIALQLPPVPANEYVAHAMLCIYQAKLSPALYIIEDGSGGTVYHRKMAVAACYKVVHPDAWLHNHTEHTQLNEGKGHCRKERVRK